MTDVFLLSGFALQTKQLAHRTSLLFKLMGLNCAELHGNLTQQMRVESLER